MRGKKICLPKIAAITISEEERSRVVFDSSSSREKAEQAIFPILNSGGKKVPEAAARIQIPNFLELDPV